MHANTSQSRRLRAALALGAIIMLSGVLPARAAQTAVIRNFTVDIDGTVPTGTEGADGVYTGDADATLHLTIANTSVTATLGSADVLVPAPLVVTAVDGVAYGGGATLQLRDLDLAAGDSLDYTLTARVQSCVATAPADIGASAKESAGFDGEDDDFTLQEGADTTVAFVGACSLAWVNQPTSALRTQTITRVAFSPSASAITVELRDAGNTGRATGAPATVGLTASRPGSDPASGLGGTTSVAAVNGLASFSPGPSESISALKYRLTATSPGLTSSGPSNQFDIVDARAGCPGYAGCGASATVSSYSYSMNLNSGNGTGDLLLSVSAADSPSFECSGYPRSSRPVSGFDFLGGSDRFGTFTQVVPNASLPVTQYQVCWAAPYVFRTKQGNNAGVQGTKPGTNLPLYVGMLPDCGTGQGAPCVSLRYYNSTTRNLTLSVMASSDDPWRY